MDLKLLRYFTVVAEELHFGRAARRLDMLPSSLSRNISLLEQDLGLRLLARTTREVSLTPSGHLLLELVQPLLDHADRVSDKVRSSVASRERVFRIGAMDSAATGLMPQLIHDFREVMPDLELLLLEEKSAKLLPKLLSGALDVAIISQPMWPQRDIEFVFLLNQRILVALPEHHELARQGSIQVEDLEDVPLILPTPRSRPHSHHLAMQLFQEASLKPRIAQQAEEKQTILNMVGAEIGAAIVPYWVTRNVVHGVVFKPLVDKAGQQIEELPLGAAWVKGLHDEFRDSLMELLKKNLDRYSG